MNKKEAAKLYRDNNKEKLKEYRKAYYHANKERIKESQKRWNQANPEYYKEYNKQHLKHARERKLQLKYGLIEEDYQSLFNAQQGKCAICKTHQSFLKRPLFVDHNHSTGKVRGLLCHHCNMVLGHAKDNIENLEVAILYLIEGNK